MEGTDGGLEGKKPAGKPGRVGRVLLGGGWGMGGWRGWGGGRGGVLNLELSNRVLLTRISVQM